MESSDSFYSFNSLKSVNPPSSNVSGSSSRYNSKALLTGNYKGFAARTSTGGINYVLAVPSIITTAGSLSGPNLEISTDTLS